MLKKHLAKEGKLPAKWYESGKAPGPAKYTGYELKNCTESNTKDLESKHIFYGNTGSAEQSYSFPYLVSNFGDIDFSTATSWEFGTSFVVSSWGNYTRFFGCGNKPSDYRHDYTNSKYHFSLGIVGKNLSGSILGLDTDGSNTGTHINFSAAKPETGTRIWFRYRYDGEKYYAEYRYADQLEYICSVSGIHSSYPKAWRIPGGLTIGGSVLTSQSDAEPCCAVGPFYLDDTYFNMNGELLWVPFENPAEEIEE